MTKHINKNGTKPGCIHRIALVNFVTYKEVVLYPGPSLNMIIGPNGTGKSTFVCAIILGLCGKTSVIGRAKKISDYVRTGCKEASIEIELYRDERESNVVITRNFNLESKSFWFIDKKSVTEKRVQELIASLNIQVDNLCQLLPQDRVQDFSKLNPQELLRSTLAAVGGQDSVEQLDELIQSRKEQRLLMTRINNNGQNLQEQIRLNERLKVSIDAMKERKKIEEDINVCEKKKLWIEYNELRTKVMQYKADESEAKKSVDRHEKELEPTRRVIEKAKSDIKDLEKKRLNTNRETHSIKDKIKGLVDTVRNFEYKIQDAEKLYQEKLERNRNREREIQEASVKLDKLKTDKSRIVREMGDPAQVKTEVANLMRSVQTTQGAIDKLDRESKMAKFDLDDNILSQIRQYEERIHNMQDVGRKRLEVLRNYSEDTYQAVMWLRKNPHLFTHKYYEPMVLVINFTDPKFARYLESTVNNRDLIAFTFESRDDMNLFIKKTKNECNLKQINTICSSNVNARTESMDIRRLSYLGFYTTVKDTIMAPDAIIRYLCTLYQIHKIPIGTAHTYDNSKKVPDEIRLFYAGNFRLSVRVSQYSKEKSSSITEVRPAKLLANAVDLAQLEHAQEQLSNFKSQAAEVEEKIRENNQRRSKLAESVNMFRAQLTKRNSETEKVHTINSQIQIQTKKLADIESADEFDMEQERSECDIKKRNLVLKQIKMHSEIVEFMKSLQTKVLSGEPLKVQLDLKRQSIVAEETKLRSLENELLSLKSVLTKIEAVVQQAISQAKEKLKEAKQSCKSNKTPNDPDFPYKVEFEKLPGLMSELHQLVCELRARMACLDQGDEADIKEYEEREKEIKRLKTEVEDSSSTNRVLDEKMTELREAWLPPLEELLSKINISFGNMFAKLDCAGEVKLEKTGEEEDYDKYGVSILVKFREGEVLQQLTRHTQSGGERTLTTAVYLMALQGLTTVPFRCVDEINQGMDPVNERKMFHLLVNVTTECDNAQYFLLTPKLLTNLEYNDRITVHTIMNGKRIMNYRKWNYDTFLQKAIQYGQK